MLDDAEELAALQRRMLLFGLEAERRDFMAAIL